MESIKGHKQYKDAMRQLFTWNQNPAMKNKQHDDFPDSLAGMLSNVLTSFSSKVKVYDANRFGI